MTFSATTDWDVLAAIRMLFAHELRHDAAYGLSERDPLRSALGGPSRGQRVGLALAGVGILAAALLDRAGLVVGTMVVLQTAFVLGVLFKLITSLAGIGSTRRRSRQAPAARVPDHELPLYTVLVPVYHEANIVGGLIEHLRRLDYPLEKLEMLLLMEEDDDETIAAARAADPPDTVRFILIPDGEPQTKPQRLQRRPRSSPGRVPGHLRRRGPARSRTSCARRSSPSGRAPTTWSACRRGSTTSTPAENVLTRMFTLEYSYWFDYMLPGPRPARPADPARRHVQPLPRRPAAQPRRLGPLQRHRGRRPGPARRRQGLHGRHHRLDDLRGGLLAGDAVDPPAHPLDQGLHADRHRPLPPACHLHARGRGAQPGRARAADRGHARRPSWRCR